MLSAIQKRLPCNYGCRTLYSQISRQPLGCRSQALAVASPKDWPRGSLKRPNTLFTINVDKLRQFWSYINPGSSLGYFPAPARSAGDARHRQAEPARCRLRLPPYLSGLNSLCSNGGYAPAAVDCCKPSAGGYMVARVKLNAKITAVQFLRCYQRRA